MEKRNDFRLWSDGRDVSDVMSARSSPSVMGIGVLSSERDVMPSFFVEDGLRVNIGAYNHVIYTIMKP